jgi:hypothetical protein
MSTQKYTVWVGGVEVNGFYLLWSEAVMIAGEFISEGYRDVQIERVMRPDLSLMV